MLRGAWVTVKPQNLSVSTDVPVQVLSVTVKREQSPVLRDRVVPVLPNLDADMRAAFRGTPASSRSSHPR